MTTARSNSTIQDFCSGLMDMGIRSLRPKKLLSFQVRVSRFLAFLFKHGPASSKNATSLFFLCIYLSIYKLLSSAQVEDLRRFFESSLHAECSTIHLPMQVCFAKKAPGLALRPQNVYYLSTEQHANDVVHLYIDVTQTKVSKRRAKDAAGAA
jgi:hypothetical protein